MQKKTYVENGTSPNLVKVNGGGQILGFDLLKFVMAIMIVAIHTKAFHDVDIIRRIMAPMLDIAVPVFFVLSSFFLFFKMEQKGYEWAILKRFLIRLLKLYAFWFVVTLPLTLHSKWYYFDYDLLKIILYIVRDFFFSHTFAGSWFLSALMVATTVIFLLKKYLKVHSALILALGMITYVYVISVSDLPFEMQRPYLFIQQHIRDEVMLTPVAGIIWCSVGCFFATGGFLSRVYKRFGGKLSALFVLVGYFLAVLTANSGYIYYLIKPFLVFFVIVLAYGVRLKPASVYMKMRNISILIYLIHFTLLGVVSHFMSNPHLQIVYFLVVLLLAVALALLILKLENYKPFRVLRYSH